MPAVRNFTVRRSRRLSKQDPSWESLVLVYPSPEPEPSLPPPLSPSSSHTSSGALTPPAPYIAPRSSHSKKKKEGHIPRPPNAFMLYRSDFWAQQKVTSSVERDHRHISRIAGMCWNQLSAAERAPYQERAALEKVKHALANPDYKYAPQYRKEKAVKRRVNRDGENEEKRCRTLASLLLKGVEGPALEKAVKNMKEDNSETDYIPSHLPSSSSSSRPRPRRPRNPKKRKSTVVKIETPPTPEISHPDHTMLDDKEFVPTEEIPPLDLSAPAEDKKPKEEPKLDILPPGLSPDTEAYCGMIKPEAIEFAQTCMLSTAYYDSHATAGSAVDDTLAFAYDYPSYSELNSMPLSTPESEESVTFDNPFNPSSFYTHELTLHNQRFGTVPVSPTTQPFYGSFKTEEQNIQDREFEKWINLDA